MDPTLERALKDAREGRVDAALAAVRLKCRLQPKDVDAVQILSLLLVQSGRRDEALHHLARAVTLAPHVAGYRNNLGTALLEAGRAKEAAAAFRAAVELDAGHRLAWLGMASACQRLQDPDGVLAASERGLALKPDWPELIAVRAAALAESERLDEAIGLLEAAVARNPCHAASREALLLNLNYRLRPREELFEAHRRLGPGGNLRPEPPAIDLDPDRPLRIGVLSGDLRSHSVGHFAEPIFRGKPKEATMVVFSTVAPRPGDGIERRYRDLADEWIEAMAMDDATLDAAIRSSRIDVLVELSGHTNGGRLRALDRKPAPVIVTAIGYPNTTGHPAVDVRIVDSITDPPGSEAFATERLVRIDPCFLCFTPPEDAGTPMLPPEDAPITFGSFNLAAKIAPEAIAMWSAAMAAVPGSRLLLKSRSLVDAGTRRRLVDRLVAGGIAADRVETLAYSPSVADHLALYSRMHVALDTFPYHGATTTCEALWMGVPVVTLAGDRHAARVGASLLSAAGWPELVASTTEEFARRAAGLATDRSRLAEFRATARDRLRASRLLDSAAYAARFHAALREGWRRHCGTAAS
jgi:predicted O-linked N-acetylglucosamine transferase (SPINDLY family)